MHQLPPNTVRLLSSSQVITSVVNVVKELTENSLDAEASSIDVKLENYGLDRIEVRDNGCGIRPEDTPVMGVRHYTSKICSHEDLETLETYGFRGEALGSICAVAEVSVTTKTKEDDISTQYTLDFTGNIVSQKPSHLGQGTTVSVQRLFRNLPVRRQYYSSMKKCKEELKKVQDVLMAFAIIKPELRLSLFHNKVVVWQKAKVADHRSALVATLGPNAVANLLPFQHRHEDPEILLDGFCPKPGADFTSTSSSSADRTFIYVNNRPVQHKDMIKLLRQHYTAQFTDEARSRYPTFVLKITVSPAAVDVNVTPDKTQVLLHHKETVLTAVEDVLVSLYASKPTTDHQTEELSLNTSVPLSAPINDFQADKPNVKKTNCKNPSDICNSEMSIHCQASNSSSSSSIAEDWIINQIPATFSLCGDDETARETRVSPEKLHEILNGSKEQFSVEEWSRGTAVKDPVSNEPLQPVVIHRPLLKNDDISEVNTAHSSNKPVSNAITEKRAALTAYDVFSNRAVRAPLSPAALFEKETRAEIVAENPKAGLHHINTAVHERWKNLTETERKKYEEKAQKHIEHHEQVKLASAEGPRRVSAQGKKRKAPLSNQQLLNELFSAQPQKKIKNTTVAKPSQPVLCSLTSLRQRLHRLSSGQRAAPQGVCLVNRLASQSAWVVLCGQRLMLLNPCRVEEALLFKRLLENNVLAAVVLKDPIQLTDGILGGSEYLQTLCAMEKQSPDLDGSALFSDQRLVANGFKIKISPGGLASAERHLEVTAMADCVPFLGIEDLREILRAVLHKKARSVHECRPLKVSNYLKSEAVRLVRQMPTHLSREDVRETLERMEQQLGKSPRTCLHGRPFLQHLSDVPATDEEAAALVTPLDS